MSKFLQPITSCLKKGESIEDKDDSSTENSKDKDGGSGPVSQPGLMWKMSSQVYNLGSGAVGLGVGSIKWAASTTYIVGTGVLSTAQTVVGKVVPSAKPKPKNE